MMNDPFLIQDAAKLLQSMHHAFQKMLELNGLGPSDGYTMEEADEEVDGEASDEGQSPSIMDASSAWEAELARYASGEFMECLDEEPMHIENVSNPDSDENMWAEGMELGIPQSVHLMGYHNSFGLLPIREGMFQGY